MPGVGSTLAAFAATMLSATAGTPAAPLIEAAPTATSAPTPLQAPETARRGPVFSGPVAAPRGGWQSVALGTWSNGRLERGVELPVVSPVHLTWDFVLNRSPNRAWRRVGTDRLVATILQVATDFRNAHPDRPPLLIGDLSRPRGGVFDSRFGGLGHLSHRNGLDVDIGYPRKDRRPIAPRTAADVDRALAQELVDRLLAAGAQVLFVGPNLDLKGPQKQVVELAHHDDHVHLRLPK